MRSSLESIRGDIEELLHLVDSIEPVNAVLAAQEDVAIRNYVSIRRRFDYASFVTALYASLESYVEDLVATYAQVRADACTYMTLPEPLQKKHLYRTAEILMRGRIGEGRYSGLTTTSLVENLHHCISGITPYALNKSAIAAHDLNLRYTEIGRMFSDIGIENVIDLIRRTQDINNWYCELNQLTSPPVDGVPVEAIEKRIEEIVERRNRIAHTGGSPDDLLGVTEMREFAKFVLSCASAMFTVIAGRYLELSYIENRSAIELELIEQPLLGRQVLIVKTNGLLIRRGQPIFTVARSSLTRFGRIIGLQLNDQDVENTQEGVDAELGIRLDFISQKKPFVYLLQGEDNRVWAPIPPPSQTPIPADQEPEGMT